MCTPFSGSPFGSPLGAGAAAALLGSSADQRFRAILQREAVYNGPFSNALNVIDVLRPAIDAWSNGFVLEMHPSGSFAKGTANKSGTDLDLFISIRGNVPNTLKEIHDTLFNQFQSRGFSPKRQNVSIGLNLGDLSVDLVPARQLDGNDHSLFHKKSGNWRKTNVVKHINYVRSFKRADEIRLLKLWRDQQGLEFPSFYLELAVIRSLQGSANYLLSSNVLRTIRYLATVFSSQRFLDPANTANVVSDDLTQFEKAQIQRAARQSIANWPYIVR
jgi:hypothetical protein